MKPHIMHVIDSLAVGGAERMLVDIANATFQEGTYDVSVCVTRQDMTLAAELNSKIDRWTLERKTRFDWKGFLRFVSLVRNKKVDLFHVHGRSSFSFLAFCKSLGMVKKPIIFHDHYGGIETDSRIPAWFRFWGRHYVAFYVGVSEKLAAWALQAGIPAHKVQTVENALNFERIKNAIPLPLRSNLNLDQDSILAIVVGHLKKDKGIDFLVRTLARCKFKNKIKILIVGETLDESYAQFCKNLITAMKLDNAIIFLGRRNDVPRLLKSVDFALIPSRSESGPLVLLEYMASGLPFVSSLTGEIAYAVQKLNVPGFFNAQDANGFLHEIEKLMNLDADQRKDRGLFGKKIANDNFNINSVVQTWLKIYQGALPILRGHEIINHF